VTMCLGIAVGHCIDDEDNVVALVVGGARCRLDAAAGCNAGEEDRGYAARAQEVVEGGSDERADPLLADYEVVGLPLQLSNELGEVRGDRNVRFADVGSAWGCGCNVDENDGEASAAEGACELGAAAYDVADGMHGGHRDDTFLQVDDDQGCGGVQFGERHGDSFGFEGGSVASAGMSGYLACFFWKFTLSMMLIAAMPAKKRPSGTSPPPDSFPARKRR